MRERWHLEDTKPYPPQDAPRWAYALAGWCERHARDLGAALVGASYGVLVAVIVLAVAR